MPRILLPLISILYLSPIFGQFTDSFNDGNFSANPSWTSVSGDFIIDDSELRSNKEDATSFGINTLLGSNISIWNFSFKLSFNPSSANYVHVFLSSDSLVENSQNGYYVKIGNTNDEISLYRLSNGISTEIISGTDDLLDKSSSAFDVSVEYKKDSWHLYQKPSGTISYSKEGSYSDNAANLSTYFGAFIKQSKSNAGKHYFDNFFVGQPPVDSTPPQIVSASALNNTDIEIRLTEPIKSIGNLQLTVNGVSAENILNSFPSSSLQARFSNPFPKNKSVTVELKDIEDLSGNRTSLSRYNWFNIQFDSALFGDIILTEIMSIPSPVVSGLPNNEFVEIYNRSAKYIDLSQYTFSDATNTVDMPEISLKPFSYAILSHEDDTMSKYGQWIPLSSFPSLNNDGDQISIKTASGNIIHQVNYKSDWHENALKKQGGWSLEMIDTQKFCLGANNWTSNQNSGGSPGTLNTANGSIVIEADFTIESTFVKDGKIHVLFNENSSDCSSCIAKISDVGVDLDILSVNGSELILSSSFPLVPDAIHDLELIGFKSCDGRNLSKTIVQFGEKTEKELNPWDLIVNEILFNPKNNDDDYVEIYNRSNKIIDLQEVFIANANDDGSIKDAFQIYTSPLTILPQSYLAVTTSKLNTLSQYNPPSSASVTEIDKMPTYSNDKGTVLLISKTNLKLHSFDYEDDLHFELLVDEDGVSLERSHLDTSNEHWSSASYKANYGTPGYKNSQFRNIPSSSSFATLLSKTISPDGDGWEDKLLIKINSQKLPAAINLTIYNEYGQLMRKVKSQQLLGRGEIIEWDGVFNNGKAPMGNYIALVEAIANDGSIERAKLVFTILKRQ
ncbi:MAG: lamin tail domain-containing protein [Bacteroidia bacterium]|nr:lamin tail domain-containing protein [Bacteroidia bacterium]